MNVDPADTDTWSQAVTQQGVVLAQQGTWIMALQQAVEFQAATS